MNRHRFISLIIIILSPLLLLNCNKTPLTFNKNIMQVHFIDVEQGDSMLIQVNGKNLLIDSGPKSSSKKFFSYIESLNIKKFDYVIYTHPHEDHIGNMANLIRKYDIVEFYGPKINHDSSNFERMVEELVAKDLKIRIIKEGVKAINLGPNTKVTVLSPKEGGYKDNLNEYSAVIKIQFGSNKFIFTGDAEKSNEKYILDEGYDIKADVLKLGHHGSNTSTSEHFYRAVNPSIVAIEVGIDNDYNHPSINTMSMLNKYKPLIFRTDKNGTIVLTSDGTNISCFTSK